jgi:hypothetical protein
MFLTSATLFSHYLALFIGRAPLGRAIRCKSSLRSGLSAPIPHAVFHSNQVGCFAAHPRPALRLNNARHFGRLFLSNHSTRKPNSYKAAKTAYTQQIGTVNAILLAITKKARQLHRKHSPANAELFS